MKTQTTNTRSLIWKWLATDSKGFQNLLDNNERISAYRFNQINEAYADGTQNQLPPIRVAWATGQVIDGRHRLMMAWIFGQESIAVEYEF